MESLRLRLHPLPLPLLILLLAILLGMGSIGEGEARSVMTGGVEELVERDPRGMPLRLAGRGQAVEEEEEEAAAGLSQTACPTKRLPYDPNPVRGQLDPTLYNPEDAMCLLRSLFIVSLDELRADPSFPPGFLRLAFHDCMTAGGGCDGSVLKPAELNSPANARLRRLSNITLRIQSRAAAMCLNVRPTLADTIAVAGDVANVLSGSPSGISMGLRLGRRDADPNLPGDNATTLPSPFDPFPVALEKMIRLGLTVEEATLFTVGGHSIGTSGCGAFRRRLSANISTCSSPPDRDLQPAYACQLSTICAQPAARADFDPATPLLLDTAIFRLLLEGKGLLTTDQDFFTNFTTRPFVLKYASLEGSLSFPTDFVAVYVKHLRIGINGPTSRPPASYCLTTAEQASSSSESSSSSFSSSSSDAASQIESLLLSTLQAVF
ncbi:Class III Peroxidase [Chara braunii]|uniref:Class III Peroxidase n=1 Tax=Chara braunii TaxID=69332 RepID=A0A388JM62_CHABU|nr:Class III Peroxidase [Chara braunii]|eukprot:GBG58888.1 Class III Peroxidase [Chara braunii]